MLHSWMFSYNVYPGTFQLTFCTLIHIYVKFILIQAIPRGFSLYIYLLNDLRASNRLKCLLHGLSTSIFTFNHLGNITWTMQIMKLFLFLIWFPLELNIRLKPCSQISETSIPFLKQKSKFGDNQISERICSFLLLSLLGSLFALLHVFKYLKPMPLS